jgi:hypothetical protein
MGIVLLFHGAQPSISSPVVHLPVHIIGSAGGRKVAFELEDAVQLTGVVSTQVEKVMALSLSPQGSLIYGKNVGL